MKYLLFPFHLLYKLYVGAIFWLSLLFLYPFFHRLLKRKKFDSVFKLKCFWSKMFQVLLFTPVKVERRAPLPKPPYIICSNHSSYLDIILFYSAFDEYFLFMGKGELLHWPLFRLFFRKMDIPVHRGNPRFAVRAFHRAKEELKKGRSIAIFPEGTIPEGAPALGSFKNGAFKLAVETGLPIVPVTWVNNYRRFGEPSDVWSGGHPGISKVVIHEPVYPSGANEPAEFVTLRKEVFRVIDSALEPPYRSTKDYANR
jgi:1-acyl-sn-glycerol-3-phosphate acyltransferase